jgi:hypothetical protein
MRLDIIDDYLVKGFVILIGKSEEIVVNSVFKFSIIPELVGWVPVSKDYLLGTNPQLVKNLVFNVVSFVDKQDITSWSMSFAGVSTEELKFTACLECVSKGRFIPEIVFPISSGLHNIFKVGDGSQSEVRKRF